jgi:hypothetical protein
VCLPEASDFIAPTPQVPSLSTRLAESTFVQAIRDEAQKSGVWVGVGIHEVVGILIRALWTRTLSPYSYRRPSIEERPPATTNPGSTPNCLSTLKV